MTLTISSLLSRVRAANWPDDQLGADFAKLFMSREDYWTIATICMLATSAGIEAIGAAVALVERVLPGWSYVLYSRGEPGEEDQRPCCCLHAVAGYYIEESFDERAATPPLAILAALLSALEQKESTG